VSRIAVSGIRAHLQGQSIGELASCTDPICLIVVALGHPRLMAEESADGRHPSRILKHPEGRSPIPEQVQVHGLSKRLLSSAVYRIVDRIARERDALA
jgi:hypothetical protein